MQLIKTRERISKGTANKHWCLPAFSEPEVDQALKKINIKNNFAFKSFCQSSSSLKAFLALSCTHSRAMIRLVPVRTMPVRRSVRQRAAALGPSPTQWPREGCKTSQQWGLGTPLLPNNPAPLFSTLANEHELQRDVWRDGAELEVRDHFPYSRTHTELY